MDVDFRTVKRTVTGIDFVVGAVGFQCRLQSVGGHLPLRVAADRFGGPGGELQMKSQAEGAVNAIHQLENAQDFRLDLVRRHENVGVVLMKGAHPEQSVEHAAELVAVDESDLRRANGQIAV